MSNVYVVTSGEYSDYGIAAIFSTEEKAKEFCRVHNTNGEDGERVTREDGYYWYTPDYGIEIWGLDEDFPAMPKDKVGFWVFMSKDGEVSVVRRRSVAEAIKYEGHIYFSGIHPDGLHHTYSGRFYCGSKDEEEAAKYLNETEFLSVSGVLARDEQHAIKIVNEKRTQLLALNRWPTEYDRYGKPVGQKEPVHV